MGRNEDNEKRLREMCPGISELLIDKDIILTNNILDCVDVLDSIKLTSPDPVGVHSARNHLVNYHNLVITGKVPGGADIALENVNKEEEKDVPKVLEVPSETQVVRILRMLAGWFGLARFGPRPK